MTVRPSAAALLAGAAFAALATGAALAQEGAQPREVPKGFVLPGPAPTNAAGTEGGQNQPPSAGNAAPAGGEQSSPDEAKNPMAFAKRHKTSDTNWPCAQRRIETIQPAQVWAGPRLSTGEGVERTPEMRDLADRLAARRLPLDQAEAMVKDYIGGLPAGEREAHATALLADLLDRLNAERSEVMGGIVRYGAKQKALAARLRKEATDFSQLRRKADASPEDIDQARQQMQWDTRVFDDRRQSLSYVCEVPTLIEQRAFGIARAIANAL